jgi:hypothetical protein
VIPIAYSINRHPSLSTKKVGAGVRGTGPASGLDGELISVFEIVAQKQYSEVAELVKFVTVARNNLTWSNALKSGCKRNRDEAKILVPMNDLITRIVNAIIRQEGEGKSSLNPGNLRGAPWLNNPLIYSRGFWIPVNRNCGVAGLAHLVALHIAQGNTLTDFIAGHPGVYAGFAPGADHNNDSAYIADVMKWASIPDATVPLWNFIGA